MQYFLVDSLTLVLLDVSDMGVLVLRSYVFGAAVLYDAEYQTCWFVFAVRHIHRYMTVVRLAYVCRI